MLVEITVGECNGQKIREALRELQCEGIWTKHWLAKELQIEKEKPHPNIVFLPLPQSKIHYTSLPMKNVVAVHPVPAG